MTTLRLNLYAQFERKFQLEAVKRALLALHRHGVESAPPEGITPPRWQAMLKHAARYHTAQEHNS